MSLLLLQSGICPCRLVLTNAVAQGAPFADTYASIQMFEAHFPFNSALMNDDGVFWFIEEGEFFLMWNNWENWKWNVNAGQNSWRNLAGRWSLLRKVLWRQKVCRTLLPGAAGASAPANILQRSSVHLPFCRSCCTACRPDWEPGKLIINMKGLVDAMYLFAALSP